MNLSVVILHRTWSIFEQEQTLYRSEAELNLKVLRRGTNFHDMQKEAQQNRAFATNTVEVQAENRR